MQRMRRTKSRAKTMICGYEKSEFALEQITNIRSRENRAQRNRPIRPNGFQQLAVERVLYRLPAGPGSHGSQDGVIDVCGDEAT